MIEQQEREETGSSFCPNCGDVVLWEVPKTAKKRNGIACIICGPLMADFLVADSRIQASDEIPQIALSRKDRLDAERDRRVAMERLNARKSEIASKHYLQAKHN